jgi:NAD-dependent dihydropyrimidine dehydrogenase PreA subunit
MKRDIIRIDEARCTGCGLCIPNCPEGALQIIDGKARLVSDLSCDGLGACIGHCPEDAITIEKREAAPYDEHKVMENIVKAGPNVIRAHLDHLRGHNQDDYLAQALAFLRTRGIPVPAPTPVAPGHACPGSKMMDFRDAATPRGKAHGDSAATARAASGGSAAPSQLRQ